MIKFTLAKVTRRGRLPSVFKAHVPKKTRKDNFIEKLEKEASLSYEEALSIANAVGRVVIGNGSEGVRTTIEGLKRFEITA